MTDYHASYTIATDSTRASSVVLSYQRESDPSKTILQPSTQTLPMTPGSDIDNAFVYFTNQSTTLYGVQLDWSSVTVPINAGLDSKTHGFHCYEAMHFEIMQSPGRQLVLTATPSAFTVKSFANCTITVDGEARSSAPFAVPNGARLVCETKSGATENLKLELEGMPQGQHFTLCPNCDVEVKSTGKTTFFIGSGYDVALEWWLQVPGEIEVDQPVGFKIVDTAGTILGDPTFQVLRNKAPG